MITPRYQEHFIYNQSNAFGSVLPDRSRPVLILGNGPSLVETDPKRLPVDPYIFRSNWFFLEPEYFFGRSIDVYFWTTYNRGLHKRLRQVALSEEYSIRSYSCPFTIPEDNDEPGGTYNDILQPQLDHWSVLSSVPALGRAFMSRPLPTQGAQMVATALTLGFRDIYVVGVDFYANASNRYFYAVPDEVRSHLKEKDYLGGYEENHSLALDIRFLQLCAAQFPDARIHSATRPPDLTCFSELPEPRQSGYFDKARSSKSTDTSKYHAVRVSSENGRSEKVAFVTLADRAFKFGLIALANSLAKQTQIPLVVMLAAEDIEICDGLPNVRPYVVKPIANPNFLDRSQKRFSATYTKLNVFGLDFLDKAVFLDSDTVVLGGIDELFDHDSFSAAPDTGQTVSAGKFNSGVFVCQPNAELFIEMKAQLNDIESDDGGDQGFLNTFFPNATVLDGRFNTLKRLHKHLPMFFDLTKTRVLHFVGVKPWGRIKEPNSDFALLEKLWFGFLNDEQKFALMSELRSQTVEARRLIDHVYGKDVREAIETAKLKSAPNAPKVAGTIKDEKKVSPLNAGRRLFAKGRYEEAYALHTEAFAANPKSTQNKFEAARALVALGRTKEAMRLAYGLVQENPNNILFQRFYTSIKRRSLLSMFSGSRTALGG